jgi:hypothetical protein
VVRTSEPEKINFPKAPDEPKPGENLPEVVPQDPLPEESPRMPENPSATPPRYSEPSVT